MAGRAEPVGGRRRDSTTDRRSPRRTRRRCRRRSASAASGSPSSRRWLRRPRAAASRWWSSRCRPSLRRAGGRCGALAARIGGRGGRGRRDEAEADAEQQPQHDGGQEGVRAERAREALYEAQRCRPASASHRVSSSTVSVSTVLAIPSRQSNLSRRDPSSDRADLAAGARPPVRRRAAAGRRRRAKRRSRVLRAAVSPSVRDEEVVRLPGAGVVHPPSGFEHLALRDLARELAPRQVLRMSLDRLDARSRPCC